MFLRMKTKNTMRNLYNELPNGWTVRFSACPTYDANMQSTESGIEPDCRVDMLSSDFARGEDTIIEFARRLIDAARTSE